MSLMPVEGEVKNLLDMFEFFLTERQFNKSIESMGETVRDMRHIIGRLLVDHFMGLGPEEESKFCSALASMLADRTTCLPNDEEGDKQYCDYCIGEILTSFEYAQELKENFPDDPVMQKILALDIPILRPLDYGLRGRFKLITSKKRRKMHG